MFFRFLATLIKASLLVILLYACLAHAESPKEVALAVRLWESDGWLALLHYQKTLLGTYEALAEPSEFYLAPNGRKDPEAELLATLEALHSNADLGDAHAICRFPARKRFLVQALGLKEDALPKVRCVKLDEFSSRLAARSATLIFSSYYLNNPASAFGHTLLRLNKNEGRNTNERFELLDFGVNFAARVSNENAFLYGFKGLFGLFKGEFIAIPYYYKVREYNDYEARDLWEYDLSLSPEEVDFLIAHLWEVGNTWFRYYYLDKNCSYLLMRVLDAVRPSLQLTRQLPRLYVIPADTIRTVAKAPGLVQSIRYRPAPRTLFTQRYESLSPATREAFKEMIDLNDPASPRMRELSPANQVAALDASLDYFDSRYARQLIEHDPTIEALKHRYLLARADHVGEPDRFKLEVPNNDAPHLGHRSSRFGVSAGAGENQNFVRGNFRFALHDLADPIGGYPSYAEIDFFGAEAKYFTNDRRFELDDFSLVQIVSLAPLSDMEKKISWRVKLGATTLHDDSCSGCVAAQGRFGGGGTLAFGNKRPLLLYLMGLSEVTASGHYRKTAARIGVGPAAGLRWSIEPGLNLLLESERLFFAAPYDVVSFGQKAIIRWAPAETWSFDCELRTYPRSPEGSLTTELSAGIFSYF